MPQIVLFVICGLLALLAGAIAFKLLRRNWLLGWLRGTLGLAFLFVVAYSLLLIPESNELLAIPEDGVVATVSVSSGDGDRSTLTYIEHGGKQHKIELRGDLWGAEYNYFQWRDWIKSAGGSDAVKLMRLRGRYLALEKQRSQGQGLLAWIDMDKREGITTVSAMVFGGELPSVLGYSEMRKVEFVPLVNGALYGVSVQSGRLSVNPLNSIAEQAIKPRS